MKRDVFFSVITQESSVHSYILCILQLKY